MKIFLDTANIKEIQELAETGLIDGVTTNPSLLAKEGKSLFDVLKAISQTISGPVSAEVTAVDRKGMMEEALKLAKIGPNIAIKVPLTEEGLKVCNLLRKEGIMVNVTLCFSSGQAILAAKAGASFISPFIGRLDDISFPGIQLIQEICEIYANYSFETEVLAASIRHPLHVIEAARIGAHVITLPPKIFRQLFQHPLTDKGIEIFLQDWKKTGQSIL